MFMKKLYLFALAIFGIYTCVSLSSCSKDDEVFKEEDNFLAANAEGVRILFYAQGINIWGGDSEVSITINYIYLWLNTNKRLVLDYYEEPELWIGNNNSFSWSFDYYTFTMNKAEEIISSLYKKDINDYPALQALYEYIESYAHRYKYITVTQPYSGTGEIILFNQSLDISYK